MRPVLRDPRLSAQTEPWPPPIALRIVIVCVLDDLLDKMHHSILRATLGSSKGFKVSR